MSTVSVLQAPQHVADAVKKASRATGTDFEYLLKTAARESSFRTDARAKTSSATGLFQFVDSTWLQMVKEEGPRFGLGDYSAFILKGTGGRYSVSDPGVRQEILGLRNDPEIAATMAGAFTQQNEAHVGARLGRAPTRGELYMAHVLGAEGASRLIELANDRPDARADRHFPRAAEANRAIFYSGGKARSVSDIYEILARKHRPANVAAQRNTAPEKAPSVAALPERKPVAPIDMAPVIASHFANAKFGAAPAKLAAGAIGPWTTVVYGADKPGMAAETAHEPRVAGSMIRKAVSSSPPVTAEQRAEKAAATPPQPKSIKIPSAAFSLFAEEVLGGFELGGA